MAKKDTKNEKGAGRLQFDGRDEDEVVSKLEEAWGFGATNEEAAAVAGITRSALQKYMAKHPEVQERRDELRETVNYIARSNIVQAIQKKDIDNSKWWIERKLKKEFSLRQENDNRTTLTISDEEKENLDAVIKIIYKKKKGK